MGTNWQTNVSWLAQAPGPGPSLAGLGYDPVDIAVGARELDVPTGVDLFRQSWADHWTPIPSSTSAVESSGKNGKGSSGGKNGKGLSGGAIAGIVVGVVVFCLIVAGLVTYALIWRSKRAMRATQEQSRVEEDKDTNELGGESIAPLGELDPLREAQEVESSGRMSGLAGAGSDAHELPAQRQVSTTLQPRR